MEMKQRNVWRAGAATPAVAATEVETATSVSVRSAKREPSGDAAAAGSLAPSVASADWALQ